MKKYKIKSAAWNRQKETQRYQRLASARKVKAAKPGQKFLYPGRRDANGKLKPEYRD